MGSWESMGYSHGLWIKVLTLKIKNLCNLVKQLLLGGGHSFLRVK